MHPVGPQPPEVYWWRRGIVAAIVLGVLAIGYVLFGGGEPDAVRTVARKQSSGSLLGSPSPTPTPTLATPSPVTASPRPVVTVTVTKTPKATPSRTPEATATPTGTKTPTPTPTATRTAVTDCADRAMAVFVAPDSEAYPEGTTPRFTLVVRNLGKAACRRDLGPRALELVVASATKPVWSSDHCKPAGTSDVEVLEPGERFTTTMSWSRWRTSGGCATPRPVAGPGSYTLQGRAGEVRSESIGFVLR